MTSANIRALRSAGGLALLVLVSLATSGCFNPFDPRIALGLGRSEPPPVPATAENTLLLFQWCWRQRAIDEYREIFTDDYEFQFSSLDSAGNAFRDRPWTREDELIAATNLFVGGSATEPPATSIQLDFTSGLVDFPDSRPGKNSIWHREIRTEVILRVNRGDSQLEVRGPGLFFLVRGDSAAIPQELKLKGFVPNKDRWYIERWEDETIAEGAAARRAPPPDGVAGASAPPRSQFGPESLTWGTLKAAFRH